MNEPSAPCVLMAEDEMVLAMMLEDILAGAGYRVCKAARLPEALLLAGSAELDAAILDINLAGEDVFPVADVLRLRGIPLMFASGYGPLGVPEAYRDCDVLQKPYVMEQLLHMVASLLAAQPVPGRRHPDARGAH